MNMSKPVATKLPALFFDSKSLPKNMVSKGELWSLCVFFLKEKEKSTVVDFSYKAALKPPKEQRKWQYFKANRRNNKVPIFFRLQ